MNKKLIEKVIHPAFHRLIKRDELYKWFEFYQQSQWWPKERIIAYQWELLQKLLRHAYEHVPYYRQLLQTSILDPEHIKDWEDFRKIPFLSKELVSENRERITADNISGKRRVPNSTSGSTGVNFYFISDRDSFIKKQALQMRLDHWMNMGSADRETTIWGASWDVRQAKRPATLLKHFMKNKMMLSAYHFAEENMADYLSLMKKFGSEFLHGYPSTLYRFACFLEKQGVSFPLKGVRTAGESLYDYQREMIERVFETRVFNYYSSRDITGIAQEDGEHDGLYIQAENVVLEVVDEKGNPVFDREGEIVLTDLHNYVMPFIRYRIGDRGVLSSTGGSSGRGLPMLKTVTGRTFELITFPNGNAVGGTFWTLLLKSEKGIDYFQVIQKQADMVLIYIVPNQDYIPSIADILRKKIWEYSGNKMEINFSLVESIPLTPGGKMRYVISELGKK